MSYRYKGMIVDPRTQGPSSDSPYSAYLIISKMYESHAEEHLYYVPGRFKSKELALETALHFGKVKVDELLLSPVA
jgi:hypothetical protein